MQNVRITPNTIVPRKQRLVYYKKALTWINKHNHYPLCILLPKLLWGLKDIGKNAPNGERWFCENARIMFPELNLELNRLNLKETLDAFSDEERTTFLENVIKELS